MVTNSDEKQRWENTKLKIAVFLVTALLLTMVWLISRYCGIYQIASALGVLCGMSWAVCGFTCCYFMLSSGTKFPKLCLATFGYAGVFAADMTAHLIASCFGYEYGYEFTVFCLVVNFTLLISLGLAEVLDEIA